MKIYKIQEQLLLDCITVLDRIPGTRRVANSLELIMKPENEMAEKEKKDGK